MKKLLFIISLVLICSNAISQQRDINTLLNQTLRNRGLTREDITIPIEFFSTAEKNPTNDVKLTLPLVMEMMTSPLGSISHGRPNNARMDLMDDLAGMTDLEIYEAVSKIMQLRFVNQEHIFNLFDLWLPRAVRLYDGLNNPKLELTDKLFSIIKETKHSQDSLTAIFSNSDKEFLNKNIFSILEESDSDDNSNFDILKYNAARDSSILTSKKTMDILSKLDLTLMDFSSFNSFKMCNTLYNYVKDSLKQNSLSDLSRHNNKYIQGDFCYYSNEDGIRIAIGGPGKNIYTGKFDFIIDLGGDDIYNIDHPPLTSRRTGSDSGGQGGVLSGGFSCIIDLAGNDYYTTSSDFALAGGLFSSSFIFDKEGDDFYESKGSGNLGAAIGGLGLLYDEKGNDTYKGISFSIGAGCFGVGLLVDREGNDFYIANSYSQGFGMTEGVGAIIDNKGNDSYLVDSRSLDIGRYNDHYVSMCQGYGLGLRPFYAGGIGLIIEGEGNDIYNTDIFGQGGAYWYSLGAIVDKGGHDKYNGYQYSQGAGIHLAVGLLKDYDGWDFYQSNGVSQGCGHDFGYGMLWDVKGNDNYSAYSLSQGAGNADGIGILVDESGTDGYLNKYPANTRGYGNQRREYGSIGVFLDASGTDYYSQPGYDSTFINSSNWGVFTDFDYTDLPEQVSGDNFKVPVDSNRIYRDKNPILEKDSVFTYTRWSDYYLSEYFIMAKTIEPRFSLWQDYGFKKLIEDSTNTANYIVTKFSTTDHRDVQVFRVLSQKIQWSIAQVLLEKFRLYTTGAGVFTQAELSMMCYIFGETKDPSAKDYLLQLTYDDNYRLRSSAINALGKINYDRSDKEFIDKVTKRLGELATEKSEKKIYIKDIAFAINNYELNRYCLDGVYYLLNSNYYGARFLAAQSLQKLDQTARLYIMFGDEERIRKDQKLGFQAFLFYSSNISDTTLQQVMPYIKESPVFEFEEIKYNLIDALKYRMDKSADAKFTDWCKQEIYLLQSQVPLKVK